jgi:cobaltochelatase CobS
MVMELARKEGARLERVNLNGGTTDTSLVGEKGLRSDEAGNTVTYFQYGILPKAMKEGAWLLLDEIDFCQPEYLAVMQAVFEGNGTPLTIMDNEGEKIHPHPDFRIIATANTLGRGDTNGYHGTNMLNIATLDRWSVITMDYTKHEPKILLSILGDEKLVDKMMTLTKRIREAIKQGQLPDFVFSTRRLICWAEALLDSSLNFVEATEVEIMGRYLKEERAIIGEFIKDIFAVKV